MRGSAYTTTLCRLYYLLRYHRPEQLARRMMARLKREWGSRSGGVSKYERPRGIALSVRDNPSLWAGLSHRLESVGESPTDLKREVAGEFTFLNQLVHLGHPVDWRVHDRQADHLWRFHLHYHEFLIRPLLRKEATREEGLGDAWHIVEDWIDRYPITTKDALLNGWHPFCISRRLPVWICLWLIGAPRIADKVLTSIHSQASYLADNLERDIGGNHLLENLRTLVVVGAFLSCGDRYLEIAQTHLEREVPRQILKHGEHYERCPMYHACMLDCLIEICQVVQDVAPAVAAVCAPYLKPMAEFLVDISHPDGLAPQFGDTSVGDVILTTRLVERSAKLVEACEFGDSATCEHVPRARAVGEYWTYRNGTDFLVFDAAAACADELPGHAHADLLGYELSLDGQRVVTDSGVFDYRAGAMRDYCRGTAAHNVLLIDNFDQFDVWSRFRMGYRGVPTCFTSGDAGNFCWATAKHDAYRRLGVPETGRCIVAHPTRVFFVFDWALGKGCHLLESLIHLHRDVSVNSRSPDRIDVSCHDEFFSIQTLPGLDTHVQTSWACPRFGERVQRSQIRISCETALPGLVGYWIAPSQRTVVARIADRSSNIEVTVDVDGDCSEFCLAAGDRA